MVRDQMLRLVEIRRSQPLASGLQAGEISQAGH